MTPDWHIEASTVANLVQHCVGLDIWFVSKAKLHGVSYPKYKTRSIINGRTFFKLVSLAYALLAVNFRGVAVLVCCRKINQESSGTLDTNRI